MAPDRRRNRGNRQPHDRNVLALGRPDGGCRDRRLAELPGRGGASNRIGRDFQMEMQPSIKPLRRTGLDVLGDRPWGSHFCMFFDTKADLLEILVPYFKAGLANNEFCFWVLADPLTEDDARDALKRAIPPENRYLIDRQMEF